MKAFIIFLPSKEHSVSHASSMLETLKNYNIDAELFEGCPGDRALQLAQKEKRTLYPYSIKSIDMSDEDIEEDFGLGFLEKLKSDYYYKLIKKTPIGEDQEKASMPGVIGCFYSHYKLWQKCAQLKEPIMIFEDDVKFFRGWEPIEWDDVLVLSLGKNSFYDDPWKTYLESPTGNPQPITWKGFSMPGNSGYAIKPKAAQRLIKFYKDYFYPADNAINQQICSIQVHSYLMGRNTLKDEGNISMTRTLDWV